MRAFSTGTTAAKGLAALPGGGAHFHGHNGADGAAPSHITFKEDFIMRYLLFPKYFAHLSNVELSELCAEAGIEAPMPLIRNGFLSEDLATLRNQLPSYLATFRQAGQNITTACLDWFGPRIRQNLDTLKYLADMGITTARIGLDFQRIEPRLEAEKARREAEDYADCARQAGLRLLLQVHHGTYLHTATAVYQALQGLDSRWLGAWIDPGNNVFEGHEDFSYQVKLLDEYLFAFGAKDAAEFRDGPANDIDKGWSARCVPAYAGRTDWRKFYQAVKGRDLFAVLMPFYDLPSRDALRQAFLQEAAYLKRVESLV